MARWRRGRVVLAVAALALLGLAFVLRSDWAGQKVCAEVRLRAPDAVGMPVRIERCVIDPLTASVEIHGVSVGPEARPVVKAELASVSLAGLFPSGVSLQDVTVIRPHVDLEIPEGDGSPQAACPLDVLARVRIGRLEIQDGTVALRLPGGRELKLDGLEVHAKVSRRTSEVEASLRHGSITLDATREISIGRVAAEATLDAEEQVLEVQKAEITAAGISFSGSGELRELCKPMPEIDANGQLYLPIDALPRMGIDLPAPSGQIWARVSVAGPLTAPSVRAEARASQVVVGAFSPGDFSAQLSFADGVVHLDDFSTPAGDGEIHLSAELKLTEGFPLKAKITTKEASLARVLARAGVTGAWVDFPATLSGEVTGHLLPTLALSGPIDFASGPFLLASRAYDAPRSAGSDILAFSASKGTFTLGVTPKAVTFDDISLAVGSRGHTQIGGTVRLGITAKGPPDLDIDAIASAIDLSDFGSISGLPWSGTGSATVKVKGPAGQVVITGQTSLRDFKFAGYSLGVVQSPVRYEGNTLTFDGLVAQKGRTQLFGDIGLDFLDSGLHTRASVQLPDGRVEDVIDLLVDLSPAIQSLQEVLVGRVSMVAAIDSPASQLAGLLAVRVSDVAYFDRRLGAANVILRFEEGKRLVLDPTTFEGPMGRVSADGSWSFDGPLDYRIAWDEGSLAEAVDPGGAKALGVSGALTGRFVLGGTTDVYELDGTLTSDEVKWKTQRLGPMKLALKVFGRDLTVTGQVVNGVTGRLGVKMRNDWPYDSSFKVDLPDLSAFLPASARGLQVGLAGAVTAVGPMLDFSQTRAVAYLEKLVVARGEVSASNVGPAELAWNAGAFQVKSLAMKGPTTEVSAEGSWGPSRVNLRTQGAVDLRLLSTFVPDVERTSGRLDFTAAFGGPVSAPTVIGSADLVDARLAVKGQDLSVRSLSGHADFSESRVVIQDVTGFLNDGRLKARGDVRLDKLSLGAMELQLDLEDVTVQVRPQVPATLSGELLLATRGGAAAPFQLSGNIDVVKLRYTEPLSLETLLETARKRSVPSDEQPSEWLRFDVDIAAGNDVRIENNLARARFLGKLKLAGTNVKPVLVGSVEAAEGAQAFFRNNVFTVGRAVLQFNGLWPTFDFSAQTIVREFLVNVKAFGRFEDPRVSLTAEPALSEADVVSLLTLGVTTREQLAGQAGLGIAGEALLSTTGLDRQVQKFLSQNVGLKDQQVRLTTTFNQATGTAEPSVTWESKVLDNLKLGVTQPVTGKGTSAQAEYRFNQSVSSRLQWDNQNQNTTVGNLGVDLRFRFEWE